MTDNRPEPLPRWLRHATFFTTLGVGVGVIAVLVAGTVVTEGASRITRLAARGIIRLGTEITTRLV